VARCFWENAAHAKIMFHLIFGHVHIKLLSYVSSLASNSFVGHQHLAGLIPKQHTSSVHSLMHPYIRAC